MSEIHGQKLYDLAERTFKFTKKVIVYVNQLPKTDSNIIIGRQLIRSAGSVGANYIEAEEALSKKDFVMRIKISRKEAKETQYWIRLSEPKDNQKLEMSKVLQEATELTKIFSSIAEKFK